MVSGIPYMVYMIPYMVTSTDRLSNGYASLILFDFDADISILSVLL